MTYIPVGTYLTYTCQFKPPYGFISGEIYSWQDLAARLKNDLPNLPGLEELDVESANGTNVVLSGNDTLSMQVLNNGVDHGDEHDVQSIIDGTIDSYNGYKLVSSSITQIKLPNNPTDDINKGQTINTGATANAPPPTAPQPSSGLSLGSILPSTGLGKTLTSGTIIVIAIIALILLLPGGFARVFKTVTH